MLVRALRVVNRPAVRIAVALVAATAAVAGMTVAGMGRGYPAEQVRLLSGSAWLASSAAGQVTLLDGSSAEVAAQLKVAPAGNHLDVVQHGATAYAIDQAAGTIRRIDGATFELTQPESPIPDARGLTAFASPETVYALDTQRGILTATDPRTLAARGQPLSLAAQLEAGSATVDDTGRLWAVDNANGDLISIDGDRRTTHRNAAKPGSSELTLAGGDPVIIDRGDRKAIVIDPETGEASNTIGLDLRPDDSIAVSGSTHAQRLYLVASRGLLAICDLGDSSCDGAIPLDASGSELGPAVEAGNRLFIPDYKTGKVWIIDLAGRTVVTKAEVLTPPARFQLLTRDGIVFFNDPSSERAGVIELNGGVHKVAKYDPKDPSKGLSGPSTGTETGEPAPTQPPGTEEPPQDQPPQTQPPTQPPPNQPPNQPLPLPQPPSQQTPPNRPPTAPPPAQPPAPPPIQPPSQPTLKITLSKANPQVHQDITLQVSNTTGPAPTSASWDFGDGSTGTGTVVNHQWTQARTYQVSVQATMPGNQQATTAVSIQVSPMPAPVHVSPANGSLFTHYPRSTTLKWNAVPGAAQYHVEVQCLHCQQVGQWSLWRESTSAATSFSFDWVGDNDGRWHVTAIAADGTPGATSTWWQFSYDTSLQTPVQVSPANGSVFNNFPRTTTLRWNAVARAVQYRVEVQFDSGTWVPWITTTTPATSYTFDFVGKQAGRWRVTAIDSGGTESTPTGWWQFVYTI
jgi:PKD domain-containing protein